MGVKAETRLRELGPRLESPPSSKDSLVKLLKQATTCLSELDQSPSASTSETLQPFLDAIVKPELLKHPDKDVKLLVAACLCEITRITAPETPYTDAILKDAFELIIGTFSGLRDANGSTFGRRVVILETLARYRSCVVMLDLDCDDLVNEMFSTFLDVASENLPESVISSMQTIMTVLLEETEDIEEDLMLVLLSALGRNKSGVSAAARRLSVKVLESCSEKLEPWVKQYMASLMSEDGECTTVQKIDYREVIYDLYQSAPQILISIIPYLTGELLSDQLEMRLRAVRLIGDLFSSSQHNITEPFRPLFSEFLKRLADRAVEIRMAVLDRVKSCLSASHLRSEAPQIISALCDRLLDYDENVRKQVVEVICDLAFHSPDVVPADTIKVVSDRLRDKSPLVKTCTMEKLADIFRLHCMNPNPSVDQNQYDWIPGKILRCYYDRDFRSESVVSVVHGSLYPSDMSVKEKVKCWVRFFMGFDKVEVKALERILEQKQRLQQEMQRYLSLRHMYQGGDVQEIHKKVTFCFKIMSRFFSNPEEAEENFQELDQINDINVWNLLTSVLNPDTSFNQSHSCRNELLKIIGEKHHLYEFLSILSLKCSYLLFSKEHVGEILLDVSVQKFAGNTSYVQSCMNTLVILSRHSPSLLSGFDEELMNCIKDDNEIIKEGALNILANAGGIIREQLAQSSSSMDLLLETLCLEGSRRQAKYAVHALAAITKDDGLKSLSILYKRLVDMLEEKSHLPAVLQSLGCIAQTAMPVFETRESEIREFVHTKILSEENQTAAGITQWDDRTDSCLLKIYGLKALVKSYTPSKDAHLRPDIDKLLATLKSILLHGEINGDIKSSSIDKAHMKLAAAKAIIRLAKYWEHKIPLNIFHLTLKMSQIEFPQARRSFLGKIHHYIKDRQLDARYACAFAFGADELKISELKEERQNLTDIIQMQYQLKSRQQSVQSDANSPAAYPESILVYLIHALAHHSCPEVDECKDVQAFESLYRQLYYFLSALVHGDDDGKSEPGSKKNDENVAMIISVLQTIKQSEDTVDVAKTKKSYALCDLGLFIVKKLTGVEVIASSSLRTVSLPSTLYRSCDTPEGQTGVCEGKTWLADENTLAHFESLKLGTENNNLLDAEDEASKISRNDEKELPLRTMMKRLKSRGTKEKEKRESLLEGLKAEKDLDVLNMVRLINLDTMDMCSRVESINDREVCAKKEKKSDINYQNGTSEIGDDEVLISSAPKALVSSSKRFRKSLSRDHVDVQEGGKVLDDDAKMSRVAEDCENVDARKVKAVTVSPKKKRKNTSVLAKCMSKEGENLLEDLIGCRIKVWWPMDKQFYEGTVKSYDLSRNRHVVLYDDGDVEILNLEKERWEIVNKGHKFAKKLKLLKANSTKRGSRNHKDMVLPESRGLNDSENVGEKRKRTPKKTSRQKKRGWEETESSKEVKEGSDAADAETTSTGDDGQIETGLTEGSKESHFKEEDDGRRLGDEIKLMNEPEGIPKFAMLTDEKDGHSHMDNSPPGARESEDGEVSPEPTASAEEEPTQKKKKRMSLNKSKSWGKSKKRNFGRNG